MALNPMAVVVATSDSWWYDLFQARILMAQGGVGYSCQTFYRDI